MKERAKRMYRGESLIIRKGDMYYTIPAGWEISGSGSWEWNNKLEDRAFSHGSDMTGDGKVKGRQLEVSFLLRGASERDHDEAMSEAYRYFAQTDYDLYAGRSDRLYHVAGISKIKHSFQKGFKQRWSEITVTLLLADPFRYEAQSAEQEFVFTGETQQAEMIVHNEGSADTPLTFTFIPNVSMAQIVVYHVETEEQMRLSDALLTAPAVLTVNTKDGTVWRGTANSINSFSGQFLSAAAGTNHFLYTGSAGTVRISFTNRWFI